MAKVIEGPLVADLELITVRSNLAKPSEEKRCGQFVESAPSAGNPVALWERHEAHPGGEVMVAGDQPVRVARTERVVEKLRNEELVQLSEGLSESRA
jgi:hypothetical protein